MKALPAGGQAAGKMMGAVALVPLAIEVAHLIREKEITQRAIIECETKIAVCRMECATRLEMCHQASSRTALILDHMQREPNVEVRRQMAMRL